MSETLPASYTTAETVTRIIPADLAPRRSALAIRQARAARSGQSVRVQDSVAIDP
jgi:hypothetical protein